MELRAPSSASCRDRKSTRLNSSHTEIYTLSLHDALPISVLSRDLWEGAFGGRPIIGKQIQIDGVARTVVGIMPRSEEHTSELQSHRDLHSFPTRRSSDLRSFARSVGRCVRRAPDYRKADSD